MQDIDIGFSSSGAVEQNKRSETWTEEVFGAGPTSGFDHVVLTGPGVETAPPMSVNERLQLDEYWDFDEIFENSRLASCIVLTKEMDGMIVYVPDRLDDEIP